jgi:two-component system cell cycle sensor histidine kinase/response regulator CckA
MLDTVQVPEPLRPLYERAQEEVGRYFAEQRFDPKEGSIRIGGERYVLIRAESLSARFFEFVHAMYPALDDVDAFHSAGAVLYDLAMAMGRADAGALARRLGITDRMARLACGPVVFARSGWASVQISPESTPTPDDDFYMLFDLLHSFESPSWTEAGRLAPAPACFMGAGYAAGWCGWSFGLALETREILCRARGDAACRFLMARPDKLDGHVSAYQLAHPELFPA